MTPGLLRTGLTVWAVLAAVALAYGAAGETTTASAPAAGPVSAGVQGSPVPRVLGTLHATVGGTARTWPVVAGASGGRPYSSGLWIEVEPGRRMVVAGGFDTATPPLDSFTWSPGGMPTSYGDYRGSTLVLNLTVDAASAPFRLDFPPGTDPAVLYSTRATLDSLDTTYGLETGMVDVTSVSIANGLGSVTGTFSGTFRQLVGDAAIEITNGAFDVSGLPDVATLR